MLKQIFQKKYAIAFVSILLICIMFITYIVFLWKDSEVQLFSLPKLKVEDFAGYSASEGYFAYDISEIEDGNPWKEEWNIKTLPVFYNVALKKANESKTYDDKIAIMEHKMELLEDIAKNFGVTENYTMTYGSEKGLLENGELSFETNIYDNSISIQFKKPIKLPFDSYDENKEQSEKIISYFIDNYKDCLNWKEAEKAVHTDYDIYGRKHFSLYAYEKGNTLEQELLNYYFNNVYIVTNEKNEMISLYFKKADLSDKIGDYPIITVEQAEERLHSGKYISTLANTFAPNMTIVKTELVYRNTRYDTIFMPCYKFFVQLPHVEENGLHRYDIYYVPAIEEQYLDVKESFYKE